MCISGGLIIYIDYYILGGNLTSMQNLIILLLVYINLYGIVSGILLLDIVLCLALVVVYIVYVDYYILGGNLTSRRNLIFFLLVNINFYGIVSGILLLDIVLC
jgi:hypothetical protein